MHSEFVVDHDIFLQEIFAGVVATHIAVDVAEVEVAAALLVPLHVEHGFPLFKTDYVSEVILFLVDLDDYVGQCCVIIGGESAQRDFRVHALTIIIIIDIEKLLHVFFHEIGKKWVLEDLLRSKLDMFTTEQLDTAVVASA